MQVRIDVSPRRLACVLSLAVLGLSALSLASGLAGGAHIFALDQEANLPVWYASSTLMLCALLLGAIGTAKHRASQPYSRHWSVLGLIFLYLSLDELVSLHERLSVFLEDTLQPSGLLYYPWVVPAAVAVVALAAMYRSWLRDLPGWLRRRFVLSALLFLGGALGMEMLSGLQEQCCGVESLGYLFLANGEELLEMSGVALFLHSLVLFAGGHQEDTPRISTRGDKSSELLEIAPS